MQPLNSTLLALPPSGIRKFFDIVATMPDVISLSVGEPDFPVPWSVREEAIRALEEGDTHYTGNRGSPQLLAAIAAYLKRRFSVAYTPATDLIVTNGGSEAFDIAIRTLVNPGDEVLIPTPSYVMYAPLTALAGGVPVPLPVTAETFFAPTQDILTKSLTPRTKAIVINYPTNPTGTTYDKKTLRLIARFAEKHDLYVISDEIYAELLYEGTHTSFPSLPHMQQRTFLLSGFSKSHAMTGLRLGYLAGPASLITAALKIHQYAALCASSLSQRAALAALAAGDTDLALMRDEYRLRRDYCLRTLRACRLPVAPPQGALYLFPQVTNGDRFALEFLKKEKVAVVPGSAFGEHTTHHIRISFANSLENIMEAMQRLTRFVKTYHS